MQKYIFQTLNAVPTTTQKCKDDPFMLFSTVHVPRVLYTEHDIEQSYQTGYVQGKSTSLTELQQQIEFQKTEALQMIVQCFPQFIQQNQQNCQKFCQNVLDIVQKIIKKMLPPDSIENAQKAIMQTFETLIDPLCQQEYLRINIHPLLQEKIETSVKQLFEEEGDAVPLQFIARHDLKVSQCVLQWPEGTLNINYENLENKLQQILTMDALGHSCAEVTIDKVSENPQPFNDTSSSQGAVHDQSQ